MKFFVLRLLLFFVAARTAFSDGGALILHQQVGSLSISVFASPAPLHVGRADLSVLLQDAESDSVLLDGTVELRLFKSGQPEVVVQPTPGQATNKLLYAATVDIPQSGEWNLTAQCREHGQEAVVHGTLTVLLPEPALLSYWVYFAVVPVAIALFILNQQLKSRRRSARLPARP